MAMTSIGRKKDLTTINHRVDYTIRAAGRVAHRMGVYAPEAGDVRGVRSVVLR
jgi:hypothetical protein